MATTTPHVADPGAATSNGKPPRRPAEETVPERAITAERVEQMKRERTTQGAPELPEGVNSLLAIVAESAAETALQIITEHTERHHHVPAPGSVDGAAEPGSGGADSPESRSDPENMPPSGADFLDRLIPGMRHQVEQHGDALGTYPVLGADLVIDRGSGLKPITVGFHRAAFWEGVGVLLRGLEWEDGLLVSEFLFELLAPLEEMEDPGLHGLVEEMIRVLRLGGKDRSAS